MNIYPDTNILIYEIQTQFSLDEALLETVNPPYTVIILEAIHNELQELSKKKTKTGQAAKTALHLIKQKDLKIKSTALIYGDQALLQHAAQKDYVVTADKDLIKKLQDKNVQILTPRQKHTLLKR